MNKELVMIVDDDNEFRDNLKDILEEHGYETLSAGSCSEAMRLARDFMPPAALLDIRLPDGSGTDLLGNLKELNRDCICAMMTAFANLETALQALEEGAFQYLQKPVRLQELLNLLKRIFDTIRLRREKISAENELRQSESTVRCLLDAYPSCAMLIDPGGRIIAANKQVAESLGQPPNKMSGIDSFSLTPAGIYEKRKQKAMEAIQSREAVRFEEVENEKILETVISPILNDAGEVTSLAIFSNDITTAIQEVEDRRKLEASLIRAQRMEAIGTLAGGIAHDFNNLLQVIQGYTQLLLIDRKEEDDEYQKLAEVEKATRRASELTKQLLTFGRRIESKLKPVDLNRIVRDVENLLRRTIPRMIDIEFHFEKELNNINADPVQIEQILMNLVVNARDAMPDGGKLAINTKNIILGDEFRNVIPECRPGEYVLLTVNDTGKGMTGEIIEHIFEPFFTTKEPGKGTGLGLAMVFGIVKNHGGHIRCESEPGTGTSFSIYLPAAKQQMEELPDETANDENLPHGSETILIVEDETTLRELVTHLLRRYGYKVLTAKSGESALALYEKRQKDISLVLLDLIMPGMGGKRCLEELLRINPMLKIVIASGYTGEDSSRELMEKGAKGFVAKPYDVKNMVKMIREIIDFRP